MQDAKGGLSVSGIYLVSPAPDFPTYFSADVMTALGYPPAVFTADLAIPTVAALAAPWLQVRLVDETVSPVDYDIDLPYVGLTGNVVNHGRMIALAREFRARGKVVLIGGPYATLSPESLRPHCDILVRGEIEQIASELFSDLKSGTWREEYLGDRPDLSLSPTPRWSDYPLERAMAGTIQTSRGCPFGCEFCDAIQYLGRRQRHKEPAQVLAELEVLYEHGIRNVYLADDNFTANRQKARAILEGFQWFNRQKPEPVEFSTEMSVDVANDPELVEACARAGVTTAFVGVETTNQDGLREVRKSQNLACDALKLTNLLVGHGISVVAGIMVGFDSDRTDIFQKIHGFAMSLPVPLLSVGALVAPPATPLHERLNSKGRIVDSRGASVVATPWNTNIVPSGMTRTQLTDGLKWLCNHLYSPRAFGERLSHFACKVKPHFRASSGKSSRTPRKIEDDVAGMFRVIERDGRPDFREPLERAVKISREHPDSFRGVFSSLFSYYQTRHMYEAGGIWEPSLANAPAPVFSGE